MRRLCLFALVALTCMIDSVRVDAEDVWVYLKDGRVGLADSAQFNPLDTSPVAVTFVHQPSQNVARTDVVKRLTRAETAQLVDAIIADMSHGVRVIERAEDFKRLKDSAAERLQYYLELDHGKAPVSTRLSALYALQFAWKKGLEQAVIPQLSDPDKAVRKIAYTALCPNLPKERLYEIMKPFADDPDPEFATLIFQLIEHYDPSAARLQSILERPSGWTPAISCLSRYFDQRLPKLELAMLERGKVVEQRGALLGLLCQEATGAEFRRAVAGKLSAPAPDVRELAAEYLAWNGESEDAPALETALKTENDAWTKAGLTAALKQVAYRAKIQAAWPAGATETIVATQPSKKVVTAADYDRLGAALASSPTKELFGKALETLQNGDAFEPRFVYGLATEGSPLLLDRGHFEKRNQLRQLVHAVPYVIEKSPADYQEQVEYPVATHFSTPVRSYYDPHRHSFGYGLGANEKVFANSTHVGDDNGWLREHTPVVCIAEGLVREVEYVPSWGHIVIIEHRLDDGTFFCSLYGHMTPLLHVKPGDVLQAGQKIGAIGRNQTCENGGYSSHLHFGIHTGPYIQGQRWICGYISPEAFARGQHGWFDPQVFLKEHGAPDSAAPTATLPVVPEPKDPR